MLDHTALTAEAAAYFEALPLDAQVALKHSNLTFRTLEDLKSYQSANLANINEVLYRNLPDPAIPSNSALDPLDAE